MLGLSVAAVRNRSLPALRSLRGLLGEDALSGPDEREWVMTNDESALREVIEGSMAGLSAPTSRISAAPSGRDAGCVGDAGRPAWSGLRRSPP